MHDPMCVAFEIPRPIPKRSKSYDATPGQPRWRARYKWATWRKPWKGWSKFWTVAGIGLYWPSLITVWHVEPGGRDALTVCRPRPTKRPDGTWHYSRRWHWHVHHWHIQIPSLQHLRRALLTRCEECGRKGSPNVSHQWDRERGRWWQGERGLYHGQCSGLISMRCQQKIDEALIRTLFAAFRLHIDADEAEALARLTNPGRTTRRMEFNEAYRLTHVLGYERDSNYELVKKAP